MLITILANENVERIFYNCLFQSLDTGESIRTQGISMNVDFHAGRLEAHKHEIESMLGQLPIEFQEPYGASFLNAWKTCYGNQWTSLHRTMEHLLLLGLAVGKAKYTIPQELWYSLYGGMPYFAVLLKTD